MTKKKSTKRALISSLLILAMCFTMLAGTTFAWFTDSVTSAGNIIKSGKLDIEVSWANGTEDPAAATWTDASTGAIFDYDLWEPGYVQVRHIKIENVGNLALKYQFAIRANGEVSKLADVIDVYYADPAVQIADRTALDPAAKIGTLTEVLANMGTTASGKLLPTKADKVTIALKMQETAGNEYQNLSIGSSFSVQVLATQAMEEIDSFDKTYDELADGTPDNANWPVIATSTNAEFETAIANAQDGDEISFSGDAQFFGDTVESAITISGTDFDTSNNAGTVAIYNTEFKKDVTFKDCDFESNYGILNNKFDGDVTFENCDMHNTDYGIYNNKLYGDATFKNCTLKSDWCYTVNFQGGSGANTVLFEDCVIYGWCSFGNECVSNVIFKNCTFKTDNCEYASLRLYQNAQFIDCDFTDYVGKYTGIDPFPAICACNSNFAIEFTGCTGTDAANFFGYDGAQTNVTWTVDGVDKSADATLTV